MRFIGPIVRLQVQEASLKTGNMRWRRYDPAGLRSVLRLELDSGGVCGWTVDGMPVADIHHRDHPDSKYRGENGISVGFTCHYRKMRERFAGHLTDGIAGENILVESEESLSATDLAGGLVIVIADGREVRLDRVLPAAPCVEFSRFALRFPILARPDETVTEAIRFLSNGMRGYYASHGGPAMQIAVGDSVFAR
jgi:hypothetical protein